MKKIKVCLLAVLLLISVYAILELSTYYIQSARLVKEGYRFSNALNKPPYPTKIEMFQNHYDKMYKEEFYNNNAGLNYKTRPIIVFGDVYANSLDNKENLTVKLSKLTHRPVYNFASAGWGIQHLYYLLKTEEFLNTIKNPEAIIYVFVDDQINRLNSFSFYPHHDFLYLKYKLDDNFITEEFPRFLLAYRSYFFRSIERYIGIRKSKSKNPNIQNKNYRLVKRLFEESKRIAQIKYPNLNKFIILRYVTNEDSIINMKAEEKSAISQLEYNMWNQLRNDGFTIIDVSELTGANYNSIEDSSPSPESLDEMLPLFIKHAGI